MDRSAIILVELSFVESYRFGKFGKAAMKLDDPQHLHGSVLHELLFTDCPWCLLLLTVSLVLGLKNIVNYQLGIVQRFAGTAAIVF
jgi:hypothetical protein